MGLFALTPPLRPTSGKNLPPRALWRNLNAFEFVDILSRSLFRFWKENSVSRSRPDEAGSAQEAPR